LDPHTLEVRKKSGDDRQDAGDARRETRSLEESSTGVLGVVAVSLSSVG
jgi:hypothetical protein